MEYQILERREEIRQMEIQISETETVLQELRTVFTLVEYNFDGIIVTADVAHFMPPDEAYIIQSIENRAVTEQIKLGLI